MSTDDTYEGMSNRETYMVKLHIDNDQGWQESVYEALRSLDLSRPGGPTLPTEIEREYAYMAGEIIRENVEEVLAVASWGDTSRGVLVRPEWLAMRDDIGSLWRVNWDELGAAFLADLAELDES